MRSTVILSLILGLAVFAATLYVNRADITTYRAGYYLTYGRVLPSDGLEQGTMRLFIEEAVLPIRPSFDCDECVLAVSVDPHRTHVAMQHPSLEVTRDAFSFIDRLGDGPLINDVPTTFGRGPATFVESTTVDVRDAIYYLGVLSLMISLSLIVVAGFRRMTAQ